LTDKEQKISWHSFLRHAVHTYPVMSNDWINDKTGLNILQTTSIQLEIYTQLLISNWLRLIFEQKAKKNTIYTHINKNKINIRLCYYLCIFLYCFYWLCNLSLKLTYGRINLSFLIIMIIIIIIIICWLNIINTCHWQLTFMNIEKRPNTVTSTMKVVKPDLPQMLSSKWIEQETYTSLYQSMYES